jgi:hypothetical protein
MSECPFRRVRWGIVIAMILLLFTAPALAQQDDKSDEPYYEEGLSTLPKDKMRPWINAGFGVLFAIGCLALAFKNPHRSHLD